MHRVTAGLGSKQEHRPEQLAMTQFLRRYLDYAVRPGMSAIVEAGTGVGKTFAYLIAVCEYLTAHGHEDNRVVIATNTLNLLDQLYDKDIPVISGFYPGIRFEKIKGRSNYLCLRKLETISADPGSITKEIASILKKELSLLTGERNDFPRVSGKTWSEVCCDAHDCQKAACKHFGACTYNKARRRASKADVVITTHASVLTVFSQEGSALPPYTHLFFDEAHNLERNARSALTSEISIKRLQQIVRMLQSRYLETAFRQADCHETMRDHITYIEIKGRDFFDLCSANGRLTGPGAFEPGHELAAELNRLLPALQRISTQTEAALPADDINTVRIMTAFEQAYDAIKGLCGDLKLWLNQSDAQRVYWIEDNACMMSPIDVSNMLQGLFSSKTVALFSATLSVAGSFDNIKSQLGLPDAFCLQLDSPFDYRNNAVVYLPGNAQALKGKQGAEEAYTEYVAATVNAILRKTQGKTFVLFTSYQQMKQVYSRIVEDPQNAGLKLLIQNEMPREQLIKSYRKHDNAVLFGTDSFWEGVDENIDAIVIAKLPFAVPNTPIEIARKEMYQQRGLDSFKEYTLPQAAIKLKQGAGRLIRHKEKRGIIVICDPRIDQQWCQVVKATLPDMRWTRDEEDLKQYLA